LFSDILVIPEAMGQTYSFKDTGGVIMDFAVQTKADIDRLSVERVVEKLGYVDRALRILRQELGDRTALLGFTGSPWTLATFMLEGASVPQYSRALRLFRTDKRTYFALAEKLTAAVTAYLQMQVAAGVDALQIFDSHGGHLAPGEFQEASGRWMRDIVAAVGAPSIRPASSPGAPVSDPAGSAGIEAGVQTSNCPAGAPPPEIPRAEAVLGAPPIIVFSLGTHGNWPDLIASGANVLGIDWQTSLAEARQLLPAHLALQGNLAPALLAEATPEVVARETNKVLEAMRGRPGHIFNLGHGLTPAAKLENIGALVDTVKNFA
jgi:uroporphyrinogen decarboxylase